MKTKITASSLLKPNGLSGFVRKLQYAPRVLDVGCGNNSPSRIKNLIPNSYYVGLAIGDYNQKINVGGIADEYIICEPEDFAYTINCMEHQFDAVISSHNLEHCNDSISTLVSMLKVLKPGGFCYLAFPSEATVSFPSRKGTLNFFDDETHSESPPDLETVLQIVADCNCDVEVLKRRHRPIGLFFLGLFLEPFSILFKKVMLGTWSLYGFETVVWICKKK